MTSKEFYKMTSDMAYHVLTSSVIKDEDLIVGKIGLVGKSRKDAEKFLSENHFFSFDCNVDDIDLEVVTLVLEFHYGIDEFDAYSVDVCDTIDCRGAGGRLVLSCTPGKYELINEVRPEKKVETLEDGKADGEPNDKGETGGFFKVFDDFLKDFRLQIPPLPKFSGFEKFDKVMDDTMDAVSKIKDSKDGKTKFYDFCCTIDPEGNVFLKRSTNDGTVTKNFNLLDGNGKDAKSDAVKSLKEIL